MSALDDHRSPWMNEELDSLRELAHEFFAREAAPHQERWIQQKHVDREFWNKAGEAGLLCLSIPEEYGGGGGHYGHEAVVIEEQARIFDTCWGNTIHSAITAPYIVHYGTEEQKKKFLPKAATGETVFAIAMTEPGAGSDLQGIKTTARLDGDEYVINGSKTFITNGAQADVILTVVRTGDEGSGAKGISLMLVEADREGFSRGRVLDKLGLRGQDTAELFYDNVRVPKENLLGGEEGQGFYQLMQQLGQERLGIAVGCMGAIEASLRETIAYTKERTAFGRSIFDFQNTKFELAECVAEAMAVRTLVDLCISELIAGTLDPARASMAKLIASDKQAVIIDRCLQLHGGYGFMNEYPIARAYADARVQRIYGGTNEIMKELIARSL
ncbi:acyl-CoA dehydrogenase [Corynebacterium sp. zg254]|uniref:Acyl-CoA dehydrogenase n=1 Tax=Corynebacterium zhongnanshanii TaxID=2768834 RepID=A0ABQ6VE46_9CORY|nr:MULTISPECIES: acyl-CoA dehydrogenase family protein [Corynebacterium]KAB3522655.1 acyl-CoA dehydrogenase [Corynebacterium zhongnanshanii]MCR5914297.1 acyl-CoA dehydrogenase [Corynebacterium sp. zg254]